VQGGGAGPWARLPTAPATRCWLPACIKTEYVTKGREHEISSRVGDGWMGARFLKPAEFCGLGERGGDGGRLWDRPLTMEGGPARGLNIPRNKGPKGTFWAGSATGRGGRDAFFVPRTQRRFISHRRTGHWGNGGAGRAGGHSPRRDMEFLGRGSHRPGGAWGTCVRGRGNGPLLAGNRGGLPGEKGANSGGNPPATGREFIGKGVTGADG